jgi:hypothetical protein
MEMIVYLEFLETAIPHAQEDNLCLDIVVDPISKLSHSHENLPSNSLLTER